MQSYYELEHVPGHRFEFQQRVRTNKSFDLARDRSAARVRQAHGVGTLCTEATNAWSGCPDMNCIPCSEVIDVSIEVLAS